MNRLAGWAGGVFLAAGIGEMFDPRGDVDYLAVILILAGSGLLGQTLGAIADAKQNPR